MLWGILLSISAFIISYNIMIHFGLLVWTQIMAIIILIATMIKVILADVE